MPDSTPDALTPTPIPWSSPLVDFDLSFNLPDGTPIKVRVQGRMSEPWTLYELQQATSGDNIEFLADLAATLALSKAGLSRPQVVSDTAGSALASAKPSNVPYIESQIASALAMIRALTSKVSALSSQVAALQAAPPSRQGIGGNELAALLLSRAQASRPGSGFQYLQGNFADRPAPTDFSDGSVIYYSIDTQVMYIVYIGIWLQVMGFINWDIATNTVILYGNSHLGGLHGQDVGVGDSPNFVNVFGGGTDMATLLSDVTTLQTDLAALIGNYNAHAHDAGTLTAAAVPVTGSTGGTDHPD